MPTSMSLIYLFTTLLILAAEVTTTALSRNSDGGDMVMMMEEEELLGLFDVMGSLLDDPDWAQMHPQPCTDTPWPGIQCEMSDEDDPPIFHVTKIHIGPDIMMTAAPPCKTNSTLSDSLHKLQYLKTLSVFNCFVESPVFLSHDLFKGLSFLEHLALDSNPSLNGEIPSSLGQVGSLRILSLSQNRLDGNIPPQLGGLASLEQLDLSYNNLSGEIPDEIGGLKGLSILDLSWNNLKGEIPCSLGQLQLLQKIDLSYNKLLGMITQDLGMLKRLVLLDLSHNFLNGPLIPQTLSGLEQLQYLILDHNPINSEIPFSVGRLKSLTSLSLSGCGLTGLIPNSLSSLRNLTALSLDSNSLIGPIPSSLGSLPRLDQLNVSHNQLSGELSLPQDFIHRLGKRLDVGGNNGLCTSKKLYRMSKNNESFDLQTPACLDPIAIDEKNNPEQNPNQSKGMQIISIAPSCLYDQKLLSCAFVLSLLSSFL